ncbi:hypothetical protein ACCS93_37820 [Rhizobium ruizarguesonis]
MLIAFGVAATNAFAADYPTTGMLHNQQEDSSLTYTCTLQQGQQRLRCEFIQTAVRKEAKAADLEQKLDEARKKYPDALKEFTDPEGCNIVGAWLDMATGQISIDAVLARNPGIATDAAKFKEGMLRLQEDAKTNPSVLDTFRALAGMCDHPTEENFLKITKADHDKDLRTCPGQFEPVRAGIRLGLRLRQWRRVGGVITARRSMWRSPALAVREGSVRRVRPVLAVHCQESRHQSVGHCVAGIELLGS